MTFDPPTLAVLNLLRHTRGGRTVESTGASLVELSADVYNVSGSTDDPKHVPGQRGSWKALLIAYGIPADSACYVTNATPAGNSHPAFSVGGHMTTDASGAVGVGGTCYLMPLCAWHNSTARDGVRFGHDEQLMLELTGFLQADSPTTFMLRLPAPEPYAVLTLAGGHWEQHQLTTRQLYGGLHGLREAPIEYHIVFERHPHTKALRYVDEAHHS